MKVILLTAVRGLGNVGDVKNVSDGYAQNFLLPKKLARQATSSALQNEITRKEKTAIRNSLLQKTASELAQSLKNKEVIFFKKTVDERLFGSVTEKDILFELGTLNSTPAVPVSVSLSQPIKKTGEYTAIVHIKNIRIPIKILVRSS